MDLSVIIPAYNEEQRLGRTLDRVAERLAETGRSFEIIVVDDGSTDRTAEEVRKRMDGGAPVRLIEHGANRGKGAAVKSGVLASRGDLVLFTDADGSTPIEELERLAAAVEGGADAAIGSRAVDRGKILVRQPWLRERMGQVFNLCVRLIVMPDFVDTQCGFKLFRGPAARRAFALQTIEGFGFDVEVLYIFKRLGGRVEEVPVVWRNSPETKVRVLRDSMRTFADLFRTRRRHRRLSPADYFSETGSGAGDR